MEGFKPAVSYLENAHPFSHRISIFQMRNGCPQSVIYVLSEQRAMLLTNDLFEKFQLEYLKSAN
jgi:hypothetical protein